MSSRGFLRAVVPVLVLFLVIISVSPGCIDLPGGGDDDDGYDSEYEELEKRTLDLINDYRADQGLEPLEWNDAIARQCLGHSLDMASGDVPFSHENFSVRVEAIKEELGGGAAAENVAYNWGSADPVETAVSGWLGSPGHKANIEGDYELTGVGIAVSGDGKYYFTQMFYRPPGE